MHRASCRGTSGNSSRRDVLAFTIRRAPYRLCKYNSDGLPPCFPAIQFGQKGPPYRCKSGLNVKFILLTAGTTAWWYCYVVELSLPDGGSSSSSRLFRSSPFSRCGRRSTSSVLSRSPHRCDRKCVEKCITTQMRNPYFTSPMEKDLDAQWSQWATVTIGNIWQTV